METLSYSKIEYIKKISTKIRKHNLTSERFKYIEMSKTAKEEAEKAKKNQRSTMQIEDWTKHNYFSSDWCDKMLKSLPESPLKVAYENYEDLSPDDFVLKYESLSKPLIITGGTSKWTATQNWTLDKLYKKFKHTKVKVGDDDKGYKIKMKFKNFLEYLIYNKDDSPLYLFESSIENHKHLKELINDYEVPKYFKEDLFSLVDDERRPPYRWFLVGPQRSGTAIHVDPLGTNAWNASLYGHKLWLLLPPDTPKYIVKGRDVIQDDEDDEAIMYLKNIFPKIKEKYGDEVKEMVFIQGPGDIAFIPGGWWHVVVNLDDTIAITQNYCNSVTFPNIWLHVRKERKKMAVKFLKKLKMFHPDLYQLAIELNERDNFEMYSLDEHMLRKKRENEGNSSRSGSSDSSSSSSLITEDFNF